MKKPTSKLIPYDGKLWTLSALAVALGTTRQALWMRMSRMPLADALRDKAGRHTVFQRKACTWILIDGKAFTVQAAAKHFAVSEETIRRWVREKRLEVYGARPGRKCSHCGETGHQLSGCPELHLQPGKRRLPGAPPPRSKLRAAGILPKGPPAGDKLEF